VEFEVGHRLMIRESSMGRTPAGEIARGKAR
jgi:hypothetical protein